MRRRSIAPRPRGGYHQIEGWAAAKSTCQPANRNDRDLPWLTVPRVGFPLTSSMHQCGKGALDTLSIGLHAARYPKIKRAITARR